MIRKVVVVVGDKAGFEDEERVGGGLEGGARSLGG